MPVKSKTAQKQFLGQIQLHPPPPCFWLYAFCLDMKGKKKESVGKVGKQMIILTLQFPICNKSSSNGQMKFYGEDCVELYPFFCTPGCCVCRQVVYPDS